MSIRLPPQPTPLLGRDEELAILRDQLVSPDVRLLTLVGPGDVGKTRLAAAVADALVGDPAFPDGLWFVDVSAIRDASLVTPAVARALRATDAGAGTPLAALEASSRTARAAIAARPYLAAVEGGRRRNRHQAASEG
jgi:predicted ATPase